MTVWETLKAHQGRTIDKWEHYFAIYERYFASYVGISVRVLEIGVGHGGSLQLWKSYFGSRSQIVGIDIDPRCKEYEEPGIEVYILDQSKILWSQLGPFDIVIDDGSHRHSDQEASFKALWSFTEGVYLIEDCHQGYPAIAAPDGFVVPYPWLLAILRPKRLIKGTPSRPLTDAEIRAGY